MATWHVHMFIRTPPEWNEATHRAVYDAEAAKVREAPINGMLKLLWRVTGTKDNIGIWEADDADQLHEAIASLPLFPYMTSVEITPLAHNNNNPAQLLQCQVHRLREDSYLPGTSRPGLGHGAVLPTELADVLRS